MFKRLYDIYSCVEGKIQMTFVIVLYHEGQNCPVKLLRTLFNYLLIQNFSWKMSSLEL